MQMIRPLFLSIAAAVLAGCAQLKILPYLDQALVLQEFGREKESQHNYVNATNGQFNRLNQAILSGDIKVYKTRKSIVHAFGPPILEVKKRALYRKVIGGVSPRKVYIHYDDKDKIVGVECL